MASFSRNSVLHSHEPQRLVARYPFPLAELFGNKAMFIIIAIIISSVTRAFVAIPGAMLAVSLYGCNGGQG